MEPWDEPTITEPRYEMPLDTALKHAIADAREKAQRVAVDYPAVATRCLAMENAFAKYLAEMPKPPPFVASQEVDRLAEAKSALALYNDHMKFEGQTCFETEWAKDNAQTHALIAIAETLNTMRMNMEEYVGRH